MEYINYNKLDKDQMMKEFFGWYTHTYKTYPIGLYINLQQISDWNYFHPENQHKLIYEIYYKDKYYDYFTLQQFTKAIRIMRRFINENIIHTHTNTQT